MFDEMSFKLLRRQYQEVKANLVEINLICCPRRSVFVHVLLSHSQTVLGAGQNSHWKVQSGHFLACIQCVTDRERLCVFVPSSVSVTGLIWDNPYNSALCQGWGETLNRVTKRSTAEEPVRSKLKDGQSTYAPPALTAWHFYSAPPEEKDETRRKNEREGEDEEKDAAVYNLCWAGFYYCLEQRCD